MPLPALITCTSPATVRPRLLQAVFVSDRALAHVGDDFHVAMPVGLEARMRGDTVVVPDTQPAPAHALGIVILGKGKVMTGVQPTVPGVAEFCMGTTFDHLSLRVNGSAGLAGGTE